MNELRRKKGQEITKKIIAEHIREDLPESDTDYGIITVTKTRLSTDLSYLDVYVSSLKNGETLTKFLAKSAKSIEKKLYNFLPISKIPRVRFRYDSQGKESFDIYQKIQDLPSQKWT